MDAKREEVLARLMLLDRKACVRMRPTFPAGPSRWYVCFGSVTQCSLEGRGCVMSLANGATPEEALDQAWEDILKISRQPDRFLMIYNCKPDVNIPGPDPQTWVRWDESRSTWIDVEPTTKSLAIRDIPADRIRPYSDHRWMADL